jgi:hypothetical protein
MSADIKDRINKLLAMANDTRGNEHENEVAMRMAERLMRQHNIDVADLEASTGQKAAYSWNSITIAVGQQAARATWRPMWIGFLGLGVGKFTDCRTTWVEDAAYGHCIKFEGDATDLEYAAWLFKKLRDLGYAESKSVAGKHRETFRKSYAIRLQERMRILRAERDQAMKEAVTKTGNALMIVNNKLALRDAQFGRQGVRNSRANLGSQGFHEGRNAADRANFGRPLGSAANQPRLS